MKTLAPKVYFCKQYSRDPGVSSSDWWSSWRARRRSLRRRRRSCCHCRSGWSRRPWGCSREPSASSAVKHYVTQLEEDLSESGYLKTKKANLHSALARQVSARNSCRATCIGGDDGSEVFSKIYGKEIRKRFLSPMSVAQSEYHARTWQAID